MLSQDSQNPLSSRMMHTTRLSLFVGLGAVLFLSLQPTESFLISKIKVARGSVTSCYLFDFLKDGKKALVRSLAGEYDQKAVRDRINTMVEENPVLMLSFTTCPYCIKAKACLDAKNTRYKVVELDVDPEGKAIRAELGDMVGRTSVPAIWIGQKFVGGCNDGPMGGVIQLDNRGELDNMLKSVGAM